MVPRDFAPDPSKESIYSTAPLRLSEREIRLVELQRNDAFDIPICRLCSYPVEGPHPPYIALSYAWGEDVHYDHVNLNGNLFSVGRNLWQFLHHMILSERYNTYWIDAICIDQNNVKERNHQVQMMRQIYSNATSVAIWLGEGDKTNETSRAMRILESGDSARISHWTPTTEAAILALCERQYWTRTWIVQEILLAKEIFVYCGRAKVRWSTFEDLFKINKVLTSKPWGDSPRVSSIVESAAANIVRLKILWSAQGSKPRPLMELIRLCHSQQSTDVRDKIYALHGLASDTEDMVIDYDMTVEQLLVTVLQRTLASIPSTNNLDIDTARLEILHTEETLRDALGIYHYIKEVDDVIHAEEQRITSKSKSKMKEIETTQAEPQDSQHYLSWRHQML